MEKVHVMLKIQISILSHVCYEFPLVYTLRIWNHIV